mgnify:CR=1 FL=1
MPNSFIERIRQAIRDVLTENKNKPLELLELTMLVDKKLSDGEIDSKLVKTIVDQMVAGFQILESDDKFSLNN